MSAAEGKAEADQAMALLRKAVGMGYRDAGAFRTDSALDPLRQREDFKKLLRSWSRNRPPSRRRSHDRSDALPRSALG